MIRYLVWILLIIVWLGSGQARADWQLLESGLEYRLVTVGEANNELHLLRVNPKTHRFDLLRAAEQGAKRQSLKKLIGARPVRAAINASFFDTDGNEMGLVVKGGRAINPVRRAAWGIFQIVNGRPSIVHTRQNRPSKSRSLAIQTGPRLLIDGNIPKFKNDVPRRRSGVCITPKGRVIIAAATPGSITMHAFARALKPYCSNALNFDGGSSTQFYLNAGDKKILMEGYERVPNALAVFKR